MPESIYFSDASYEQPGTGADDREDVGQEKRLPRNDVTFLVRGTQMEVAKKVTMAENESVTFLKRSITVIISLILEKLRHALR